MKAFGRKSIVLVAAMASAAGLAGMALTPGMAQDAAPGGAKAITGEAAEGAIFERQQIMEQLARNSDALGKIVAGALPKDQLAQVTRAIAEDARDARDSFQDNVPGGRSKPEVWADQADFSKRMDDFVRNAEAMAKAGEAGNMADVTSLMIDALPCKQCHDVYRAPKKP